ncbi:SDR family oxidoreductase [Paenactinomyces guangxiensis]|uniref:SDR family oxidoreductase n=1 Tax=Paenactinomyces guangxiensis TaxID=1490290 RepID=A0A7W2A9F2_9BACL|nr:SDR family oxidoreductase [Paenactinomyces guangxiensis]MBA4495665.1 SDR family oxidoreductase [Paenactinomyces guangxiensis]MBH8592653.1 SDR family oxidoreductase [Paenactinomyces guangxiensis]
MTKPVAFITGTSSGFGLLASIALAGNGYYVVASMRNPEKKKALEEAIHRQQIKEIEMVPLDVTKHEEATATIQEVIKRLGKIDVLVNNAGYAEGGFVEDLSIEDFRRQFETNFFGTIAVTKAVLPHMRRQRTGKIINISSISGKIGFPALSPYVSSKHALEGFSESLRLELLPYGVYVSLIEPGSYQTEIWSKGLGKVHTGESAYEKEMAKIIREVNHISQSAADPQEVADLIVQVANTKHPKLRYPVGKGVESGIFLKHLLPWSWIERRILQR